MTHNEVAIILWLIVLTLCVFYIVVIAQDERDEISEKQQ